MLAVGGIDWTATSGADGCVALWDVERRKAIAVFRGGAVGLAFHPDGRRLAVAALGQTIRIFDLDEMALAAEWPGHTDAVTCAAYSPDGRLLATGGDDHTVRLWDADTGAARAAADLDTQVKALCFSPDGRRLYTGNGNAQLLRAGRAGAAGRRKMSEPFVEFPNHFFSTIISPCCGATVASLSKRKRRRSSRAIG